MEAAVMMEVQDADVGRMRLPDRLQNRFALDGLILESVAARSSFESSRLLRRGNPARHGDALPATRLSNAAQRVTEQSDAARRGDLLDHQTRSSEALNDPMRLGEVPDHQMWRGEA